MANVSNVLKQKSVNSFKTNLSLANLVKDEEMEKILEEIHNYSKYSPSNKNCKTRQPIENGEERILPEEELDDLFVDFEKRNAELQELLLAVESSKDDTEGQGSRMSTAEGRRSVSTDSLVEKLMQELDGIGYESDQSYNGETEKEKKQNGSTKTRSCSQLKASASEEEFDHMLAELLEL